MTKVFNPTDPINEVIFFGKKFDVNVVGDMTEASLDGSLDQITQITLSMIDPGFKRLRSGIYAPKIPVMFDGYELEVSNVETQEVSGNEGIRVLIRPRVVRKLKRRTGKKVMKGVSPSAFVEAECKAIGVKAVTQKSAKRRQIARDVRGAGEGAKGEGSLDSQPSTWTTFQRLAQECGFIVFEYRNVIYFGKPTWLLEKSEKDPLHVSWLTNPAAGAYRPLTVPVCTKSLESKETTVAVNIPVEAWRKARVGGALKLTGIPEFNDTYLIDSVSYDLAGTHYITVTASTPVNPEKIEPATTAQRVAAGGDFEAPTGDGAPASGTKSVSSFVQHALAQAGDTYIYGHEVALSDPNPSAFDCSELVQWACARAGVYIPDQSAAQINFCKKISVSDAIGTYGALLYKPGHIAISLGNGSTIEAVGTGYGVRQMSATSRSFSWTAGGIIPGMRY